MNEKINLTEQQIAARNPSYGYQDLLDREQVDVPDALRENTNTYLGSEDLSTDRWTSREFFDREVEQMWTKTWQMVCRESQLAKPGDFQVQFLDAKTAIMTHSVDAGGDSHWSMHVWRKHGDNWVVAATASIEADD